MFFSLSNLQIYLPIVFVFVISTKLNNDGNFFIATALQELIVIFMKDDADVNRELAQG